MAANTISNDGFWTDVDLDDFAATHEAPSSYESGAIKNAMMIAITHANSDLSALKNALVDLGYAVFSSYADLDVGHTIDDKPTLEFLYTLAVYSFCKYQLARLSPALGRSVRDEDASEKDNDMSALLLERYSWAVNQLFSHCTTLSALDFSATAIPSNVSSAVI